VNEAMRRHIFSGGVEEMKIIMTIKEIACRYTKLNFPVISGFFTAARGRKWGEGNVIIQIFAEAKV
jgi:hypothetical protein